MPSAVLAMKQLQVLVAVSAGLSALPTELSTLAKLRVLAVAQNDIHQLPEQLCAGLEHLEQLDLRLNSLSELPSAVSGLTSLRVLQVQNNMLVSLPSSVFGLKQLVALHCQGNPMHPSLVELYGQFAQGATALVLTGRGLSGLPPDVAMLSSCTELLLAHNKLSWLPPEIASMKTLVAVDISHNCFERIPVCLSQLELTIFKFDHNPLSQVPLEVQKVDGGRNIFFFFFFFSLFFTPFF